MLENLVKMHTAEECKANKHMINFFKKPPKPSFSVRDSPEAIKQIKEVLRNLLFDYNYYTSQYSDVDPSSCDPYEHYILYGWKHLKNPSTLFNTKNVSEYYKKEGRNYPNPLDYYINKRYWEIQKNSSVLDQIVDSQILDDLEALEEILITSILFDPDYYLGKYKDLRNDKIDTYQHYSLHGWNEKRTPSALFNVKSYYKLNPDIESANINPLAHYAAYGKNEGRTLPSALPNIIDGDDRFKKAFEHLTMCANGHSGSKHFAPSLRYNFAKDPNAPKTIAFYLPQFHPFKENDEWWGKGFTEWTNVAKALPQFIGHYQPRLPSDLGYYDLRLTEVMKEQINMAKQHGIDAFCFHYYWFDGHRLMEHPIEKYLALVEELDFPFCLCWANENWTRRWDGSESDVLMAQNHSEQDTEKVFYDLLRYMKDDRYIKVNGKPMLVIYRPDIIPNISQMSEQLNSLAQKEGFKGIHLVATNAFGFDDFKSIGFNAIVEFPPHNVSSECINHEVDTIYQNFGGNVFSYKDVVRYSLDRLRQKESDQCESNENYYPTVMTGWDNSARKPGKGHIFHDAEPLKFYEWFRGCYEWASKNHKKDEQFIFINAWNEWAEGTYLEPDKKFGYAYLNSIRSSFNDTSRSNTSLVNKANSISKKRSSDHAVFVHIFYEDLIDEISIKIQESQEYIDLDIIVSIPNFFTANGLNKIIEKFAPTRVIVSENRGRDIWPFMQSIEAVKDLGYKGGCKIHSKKSTHLADGNKWRESLYDALLSKQAIQSFKDVAQSTEFGICCPQELIIQLEGFQLRDNLANLEQLIDLYKIPNCELTHFVAGSMFWFNFDWASKLLNENIDSNFIGPELGAIDGTVAHAFERFFCIHAEALSMPTVTYKYELDNLPH